MGILGLNEVRVTPMRMEIITRATRTQNDLVMRVVMDYSVNRAKSVASQALLIPPKLPFLCPQVGGLG
ncbi:uncharacterized protein G2W53_028037 [Senna tora]|uniref:Uncharacterized protein n=1 Tax=Senna tora TaxID=362788 RepID=A0A834WA59_9FABA|nr:uncharacterized protein G2W53_028037 [Senna tora]